MGKHERNTQRKDLSDVGVMRQGVHVVRMKSTKETSLLLGLTSEQKRCLVGLAHSPTRCIRKGLQLCRDHQVCSSVQGDLILVTSSSKSRVSSPSMREVLSRKVARQIAIGRVRPKDSCSIMAGDRVSNAKYPHNLVSGPEIRAGLPARVTATKLHFGWLASIVKGA